MSDIKDVTLSMEVLAGILRKPVLELEEALNIGDDGVLTSESIETVKELSNSVLDERYNAGKEEGQKEGHGKATREVLSRAEKDFAETYGVKKDSFMNMGKSLVAKTKETNELEDSDVQNSELYIKTVDSKNKEIEDLKTQLADVQSGIERGRVNSAVESELVKVAEEYSNTNLNLVKLVIDQAINDKNVQFSLGEDGKPLITDSSGNPIRIVGKGSDVVGLTDWFKNNYGDAYLKTEGTPPRTPGGKTTPPTPTTDYKFKDAEEANEALRKAKTPEEKQNIIEATKEQFG